MSQPHDSQELEALLKRTMIALLERVPDGYGRILKAVSEVTRDPVIDELAVQAYRDERLEAEMEKIDRAAARGIDIH